MQKNEKKLKAFDNLIIFLMLCDQFIRPFFYKRIEIFSISIVVIFWVMRVASLQKKKNSIEKKIYILKLMVLIIFMLCAILYFYYDEPILRLLGII